MPNSLAQWKENLNKESAMCIVVCMRTNIEIDKDLMALAQDLAGTSTMKETVDLALQEMVARHRRLKLLELKGKYKWEGDLKAWRQAD